MAYTTSDKYKEVIYSGDNNNNLSFKYGEDYIEDSSPYISSLKLTNNLLKTTNTTFSLDNFVSNEIVLEMHDYPIEDLTKEFYFELGSMVDGSYEYVPIGYYKIKDNPTTANGKTTYKLFDRATNFDFNYDASTLINNNGGSVTILQLLRDMCSKAGVELATTNFIGKDKLVGVYDNSITARTYVSYIAELACSIAKIGRDGKLYLIPIKKMNNNSIKIDEEYINQKMTTGDTFKISKVMFENGIVKFEQGDDSADTLFINASNPFISTQEEINDIYNQIVGFEIMSLNSSKILGNISIDPYDFIEFDLTDENNEVVKNVVSLGQYEFTFNGVMYQKFETKIDRTSKVVNKSVANLNAKYKRLTQEIDAVEGSLKIVSEQVSEIEQDTTLTKQITGNPITIEDAGPYDLESIAIDGKSIQETRSGKNLFNCNALTTQTINGVTFTPVYEKGILQYINVNGKSSGGSGLDIYGTFNGVANTNYTLNGCPRGGSTTSFRLNIRVNATWLIDTGNGISFNYNASSFGRLTIDIADGYTANNLKFYPMIRLSTVSDGTYEPYVGGTPSPNPNYPQEIKNVEGVTNLANIKDIQVGKQWNNIANTTRASIIFIPVEPNTQYALNGDISSNSNLTTLRIVETNSEKTTSYVKSAGTFTTFEQTSFVSIEILSSTTITSEMLKDVWVSLVKGTKAPNIPYGRWLEVKSNSNNEFDIDNAKPLTINASGVEGPNNDFRTSDFKIVKPNTKYYASSIQVEGQTANQIYMAFYDKNKNFISRPSYNSYSAEFTTPTNCKYARVGFYTKGQTNCMISTNNTPYEPYKETTALVDMNKKNLFDGSNPINAVPSTNIGENVTYANSTATITYKNCCEVKKGKSYIIKWNENTIHNNTGRGSVITNNEGIILQSLFYLPSYKLFKFTANSNGVLHLAMDINTTDIKIYKGIETDDYYRLASIGDIKDTFENGVLTQRIGKVVLDGSESWVLNGSASTDKGYYEFSIPVSNKPNSQVRLVSDYFPTGTSYSNSKEQVRNRADNLIYINILGSRLSSLDINGFKTWLSENNVEVYYELKTPIEHTLNYELLELHEGYNNITTNDDLEPNMSVTYLTDSKLNAQYTTKAELNIESNKIRQSVSGEIEELDKKTEASLELKVNQKDLASEINAIADLIKLVSSKLVIETDKFKLAEGVMKAIGGTIGNIEIGENYLRIPIKVKVKITEELISEVFNRIVDGDTFTDEEIAMYDLNGNGIVELIDTGFMLDAMQFGITPENPGYIEILSNGFLSQIAIIGGDGVTRTKIDLSGIKTNGLTVDDTDVKKMVQNQTFEFGDQTLNPNTNVTITLSNIGLDGYEAVGIIMIDTNNNNISIQKYSVFGTSAYITFRNTTGSSQAFNGKAKILYQIN